MRVGGRLLDVTAGDLVWMTPAQAHELVRENDSFDMWVVAFSSRLQERRETSQAVACLLPHGKTHLHLQASEFRELAAKVGAVPQLTEKEPLLGEILESATELSRSAPSQNALHPGIRRAIAHLQQHPEADRSSTACRARLAPSHLSRLFTAEMGTSLAAYRNRLRLEAYLRLRDTTTLSITQAAASAGFGSYAQFHRVFRRELGVTPADLSTCRPLLAQLTRTTADVRASI